MVLEFVVPDDDGTWTYCVICNSKIGADSDGIWDGGHNAYPIADGRCCDQCNRTIVVVERMRLSRLRIEGTGGSNE